MELIRSNLKDFLIIAAGSFLIFFVSIKGWINSINSDLNLSFTYLIYLIFLILCLINFNNLLNYSKFLIKRNIKSLDFNILLSILIFFFIQQKINFYALSFLSIYFYINSIVFCTTNFYRDYRYMYLSIIITGVLTSIGVVIGVLEAIFLETNIFFKIKSNYPGFLPFDKHFSGFQYTYNYTAYLIIAALGLIGLLKNNNNLHKIFVFLFLFTLLLTQSKVSYLYIALLMVFSFKVNFFKDCRYLLAIALSLGYLLLAHLTFKLHGSDLNLSYYLREEKFMLFDVKAYSTLFLWLKEEFFQYIFTFNLNEISMSGYQANTEGTEPHSLLLSSYLFGGTIFSFLILYRLLMNFVNFLHNSHTYNAFFISSVLTILIESIIWDAYDSPIFWLIILLCPFFNKFMEERSKLYD